MRHAAAIVLGLLAAATILIIPIQFGMDVLM